MTESFQLGKSARKAATGYALSLHYSVSKALSALRFHARSSATDGDRSTRREMLDSARALSRNAGAIHALQKRIKLEETLNGPITKLKTLTADARKGANLAEDRETAAAGAKAVDKAMQGVWALVAAGETEETRDSRHGLTSWLVENWRTIASVFAATFGIYAVAMELLRMTAYDLPPTISLRGLEIAEAAPASLLVYALGVIVFIVFFYTVVIFVGVILPAVIWVVIFLFRRKWLLGGAEAVIKARAGLIWPEAWVRFREWDVTGLRPDSRQAFVRTLHQRHANARVFQQNLTGWSDAALKSLNEKKDGLFRNFGSAAAGLETLFDLRHSKGRALNGLRLVLVIAILGTTSLFTYAWHIWSIQKIYIAEGVEHGPSVPGLVDGPYRLVSSLNRCDWTGHRWPFGKGVPENGTVDRWSLSDLPLGSFLGIHCPPEGVRPSFLPVHLTVTSRGATEFAQLRMLGGGNQQEGAEDGGATGQASGAGSADAFRTEPYYHLGNFGDWMYFARQTDPDERVLVRNSMILEMSAVEDPDLANTLPDDTANTGQDHTTILSVETHVNATTGGEPEPTDFGERTRQSFALAQHMGSLTSDVAGLRAENILLRSRLTTQHAAMSVRIDNLDQWLAALSRDVEALQGAETNPAMVMLMRQSFAPPDIHIHAGSTGETIPVQHPVLDALGVIDDLRVDQALEVRRCAFGGTQFPIVPFQESSTTLTRAAREVLAEIMTDLIPANLDQTRTQDVLFLGSASFTGEPASNLAISERRAEVVARTLAREILGTSAANTVELMEMLEQRTGLRFQSFGMGERVFEDGEVPQRVMVYLCGQTPVEVPNEPVRDLASTGLD